MQALVRVGLGLLLLLAPALCCCQARWLFASAAVAPVFAAESAPRSACPHCCHAEAPATPTPETPAPKPLPTDPHCIFCDGQALAVSADSAPLPRPPAFSGELLPAFLSAVAPVHPALALGLNPPERAGVDARFAALFDRHVMRC